VHGRLTWAKLAEVVPLIIERPSIGISSLKRHKRLHLVKGEPTAEGAAPGPAYLEDDELQAVLAELERLLSLPEIPPSAVHAIHARLHLMDVRRRLANGERVQVTTDQAGRAATALQRGELERGQGHLLTLLGGGISMVFEKALGPGSERSVGELIEGDVIEDVEVVGAEGGGAAGGGETQGGASLVGTGRRRS
jgi:hypothetical protein